MEWDIVPFEGMGPIRFGMTPAEVAAILGPPETADTRGASQREFREVDQPIVRYRNGTVNQIEAFYDVKNVRFEGMDLFETPGAEVMRRLEEANGQALEDVGVVLFDKIGITTGRLDENVREEYSVTAFARGTWEGKMEDFKPISFIG